MQSIKCSSMHKIGNIYLFPLSSYKPEGDLYEFNKLGLVASASAVLALAGCNLIPNLADPGTTTGGGQQQQQQTAPD